MLECRVNEEKSFLRTSILNFKMCLTICTRNGAKMFHDCQTDLKPINTRHWLLQSHLTREDKGQMLVVVL